MPFDRGVDEPNTFLLVLGHSDVEATEADERNLLPAPAQSAIWHFPASHHSALEQRNSDARARDPSRDVFKKASTTVRC